MALRLALVVAIQVVVVALLALCAPRALAPLGDYVVRTPARALLAAMERCGQGRAEMARLLAATEVGARQAVQLGSGGPMVTFWRSGEMSPLQWPSDWPGSIRSALGPWLVDLPVSGGATWCTVHEAGRLFTAGAAPLPDGGGWVVVVGDDTESLGEVARQVSGARSFSVVTAASVEASEAVASLTEIMSGLVHVTVPVPGTVGEAALLAFDIPTRSLGVPLRAGAIILVASVLLLAGAQALVFIGTYVQVMQPYRDLLRALDGYATTGIWEPPPGGQFREQQRAVEAISRAVQAREEAEEEARRCLQELRAFLDVLPAAAAVKDADLRFRLVNTALAHLTGRSPEEIIGKTDFDIYPEKLARVYTDHDLQVIESGRTLQFEEIVEEEGRRRTFRTIKAPLKDAEGRVTGLVSVGMDITGERELQARLAEADRAQMVVRLAGGVAHIFNNVLTAIIGSSELALLDLADDHPARDEIEEVKAAADRGARVSRQLLVLGRGHWGGEGIALVHEVLEDLLPVLREVTGVQVELKTEVAVDLPPVLVNPAELKQLLLNLVLNAVEAMPEGGRVTIESRTVQPPPAAVDIEPDLDSGATVMLRVSDTGTGIDDTARAHLFEPFFTTKGAAGGRGLGLTVVQSIVRHHHGAVLVQSQEGCGTTFEIYLPAHVEPEERAASSGDESGEPKPGHGVILLVEDEPSVRHLTERVLASYGTG